MKKTEGKKIVKKKSDLISVRPEMLSYVDKADLKTMEYDMLVTLGREVSEVKVYTQWLLGKLGDSVSTRYGKLIEYAKDIGQIYQVLQQYVNTYRKYTAEDPNFSPDKYFGSIPWSMLQMVATKSDKPIELLNKLADKGIHSVEAAFREIKHEETGKDVPRKPHIMLRYDADSNKWKFEIDQKDLDLIDWTDVKKQLIDYLNALA